MIDLLAECYSTEEMDYVWVPLRRASTERGVLRQVCRFMRAAGLDEWDVREHFEWTPTVRLIWAEEYTDFWGDRYLRKWRYADDNEPRPFVADDPEAHLWWEVSW